MQYSNTRKPTLNLVEQKLRTTTSLFRTEHAPTGDSEVNTAMATEKAVATAWLQELLGAAEQLDTYKSRETRRQEAQLFLYWRVYQSFVEHRLREMRKMSVADACKFIVST